MEMLYIYSTVGCTQLGNKLQIWSWILLELWPMHSWLRTLKLTWQHTGTQLENKELRQLRRLFCFVPIFSAMLWDDTSNSYLSCKECSEIWFTLSIQELYIMGYEAGAEFTDCTGRRDSCLPLTKMVNSFGATTILNHCCSSSPSTFSFSVRGNIN